MPEFAFIAELKSRDPVRVAAALAAAEWEQSEPAFEALLTQAKQINFMLPKTLPTRQDGARKWAFAALLYETRNTPPSNMACGCFMSHASPREVESVTIVAQASEETFHVSCPDCRIEYDVSMERFETEETDWRWLPRL